MSKSVISTIVIILILSVINSGCKKDGESSPMANDPDPQITGISPVSGPVGTNVTISGSDLSIDASEVSVAFNGTESNVTSTTLNQIETIVPENATTGVVTVTVRGTTLDGPAFSVVEPAPEITSITPDTAYVGGEIEIRGVNFGEESSATLLISSIEPNIIEYSDTLIIAEAVDPEGDIGPIEVSLTVDNSADSFDDFYILRIKELATGEFHSCAITFEGNPYCWGDNEYGQLGNNSTTDSAYPELVEIPEGLNFKSIVAQRYHTLALDEEGHVWAWGSNSSGQLGDGTTINSSVPVQVQELEGVIIEDISTGIAHVLALDESGHIWAWGNNTSGRLGDGTEIDRLTPVMLTVPQNVLFSDLSAGVFHSLALDTNGQVWAWGSNIEGKLGDGSTVNRLEPTMIVMPANVEFTDIAGGEDHSIALSTTGDVWSWGSNELSQLGSGSLNSSSTPVQVDLPGGLQVDAIEAGDFHNLAISTTGELWGWGASGSGRLGPGFITATVSQPELLETPVEMEFYLMSADRNHSLVVSSNGSIPYSWGRNENGQLGDGSTRSVRSNIQKVVFNRE